jgi:16S rRNA (guanine527-N7)-methyltransferase
MLLAWTQAINLTAIRDPVAAATLHVVDSLAAVPLLRDARIGRILDLGSGGGFPGIPLAAALPADALLVESIGKKAGFLRAAVEAIGLTDRVAVEAERAEVLARDRRDREAWPAVVARAVADLGELAELALPLVAVGGILVAWKREPLGPELEAARSRLRDLGAAETEVIRVVAPGLETHRLVVVRKGRPTADRFPRSPAERRDHRP